MATLHTMGPGSMAHVNDPYGGLSPGQYQAAIAAGQTPAEYRAYLDKKKQMSQQQLQANQSLNLARTQAMLNASNEAIAGHGQMPSKQEVSAGIVAPGYAGLRDENGNLKNQFTIDPYQGQAMKNLKEQAFSEGPSPWANIQLKQQQLEQQNAQGQVGRQAMAAQSGAASQLARTAGMTGGAAALLARQGQRDLMNAQQGVSRQGIQSRVGIQAQDIQRKNDLMSNLGNVENAAQVANVNAVSGDVKNQGQFDLERYRQQMQAWGAKKTADAQAAAGGGGKK